MPPLPPKPGLPPWIDRDKEANAVCVAYPHPCYDCGQMPPAACITCDVCQRPLCDVCFYGRHAHREAAGQEAYPCRLAAMPSVPDAPQG